MSFSLKQLIDFQSSESPSNGRTIGLTDKDHSTLFENVRSHLRNGTGFALATLNLDHIVKLRSDVDFRSAYLKQTHVVADGNPIVWLWKTAQNPVDLIPGSELIEPLSSICAQENAAVALFGSDDQTLESAKQALEKKFPGLEIVYTAAPPLGFDPTSQSADQYLEEISTSGAKVCFLALGAPKQEIFASRGLDLAAECGFVSIGAGLDFISKKQTRAPKWVRKIAMEWLWRMLSNPKRLFVRYFKCALILPGLFLNAYRSRK